MFQVLGLPYNYFASSHYPTILGVLPKSVMAGKPPVPLSVKLGHNPNKGYIKDILVNSPSNR